jgi:hypothetical protein
MVQFARFGFIKSLASLRAIPWLAFLAALAIYLSTGQKMGSGDAIPSSLIPITVLLHGTTRLDEFTPALKEQWGHQLPYFLIQTPHGVLSVYPLATGLLATPILALPILTIASTGPPSPEQWLGYAHRLQFYAAAVITAASVAVFWIVCTHLGFGPWLTLGLTAFYAFGSEAFSTSSQVLWEHGSGVLFTLIALLCFIRMNALSSKQSTASRAAAMLSLAAAIAVAVRPTNVLLVGTLFVLSLWKRPQLAVALVLPGVIIGAALLTYNLYYFDNILGGYGEFAASHVAGHETFTRNLGQVAVALAGLLFSPGRGLFFYFPFAAVVLAVVVTRPSLLRQPLPAALAFSIISIVTLFSFYVDWMAGWSFGPRYLTEVQPLILIMAGIAWRSLPEATQRPLNLLCFGVLLPYSIFVQSVGSYSIKPILWNQDHERDSAHAVWYFRGNPIARGLK